MNSPREVKVNDLFCLCFLEYKIVVSSVAIMNSGKITHNVNSGISGVGSGDVVCEGVGVGVAVGSGLGDGEGVGSDVG